MKVRSGPVLVTAAAAALAALFARAQQPDAAGKAKATNNSKAPKGIGWPSPALPAGPIPFDTGIARGLSLVITKGLVQPFSMAFLPDGAILITERPGRLRIVRNGMLQAAPVAGLPAVQAQGLTGLMDLALHPRFAENSLIYFAYNKPASSGGGKRRRGAASRSREDAGMERRSRTSRTCSARAPTPTRRGSFSAATA